MTPRPYHGRGLTVTSRTRLMPKTILVRTSHSTPTLALIACWTAIALFATAVDGVAQPGDRVFPTGLQFATPDEIKSIPAADSPFTGLLPEAHDLTSNFPEPGDQGKQGSCVGWTVAYAMKSYQEKIERQWEWNLDTKQSAAWVYNNTKLSDCFKGTTFPRALGWVQDVGSLSMSAFPYIETTCSRLATAQEKTNAKEFRIRSFQRIEPGNEFAIKAQIAAGNPVLIGMAIDKSFMNHKGGLYQGLAGPILGGHAVTIVGYDNGVGGYKIINSWGTETWGVGGFGWIAYGVFSPSKNVVLEAYVAVDETKAAPLSTGKPASAPSGTAKTYDVVYRRFESFGVRTTPGFKTENHHCSSKCENEPTETPYSLKLQAAEGRILRNPRLICHGHACPWTGIDYLQVNDRGRVADGGWFSWGTPTIWRLEGEEVQAQDVRREARQARAGEVIDIEAPSTDPPPQIAVPVNGREERVGDGFNAPASGVEYVGRQDKGNLSVYTFRVAGGK